MESGLLQGHSAVHLNRMSMFTNNMLKRFDGAALGKFARGSFGKLASRFKRKRELLYLKWEHVEADKIKNCKPIRSQALIDALRMNQIHGRAELTATEFDTFGLEHLSFKTFVQVDDAYYMPVKKFSPPYLKWERVDADEVKKGSEISSTILAEALQKKVQRNGRVLFTETEFDDLDLHCLSYKSYINADSALFRPVPKFKPRLKRYTF